MTTDYGKLELAALKSLIDNEKSTKKDLADLALSLELVSKSDARSLRKAALRQKLRDFHTDKTRERHNTQHALKKQEAVPSNVVSLQEFRKKTGLTKAQRDAKRRRNKKKHHRALQRRHNNVG